MALTTTTEVTKAVNVMFTRRFLERARYQTHYFAGTQPARVQKHMGTATALWRRFEHLTPTTTPLTELTGNAAYPTRTGTQASITDITKEVLKYGDFMVITEELDVFNFNGTTAELLDVLAAQAGRSLNFIVRNEVEDNSTLVYAGGAGSDAAVESVITVDTLNSVINTLQRNVATPFAAMTTGSENVGTNPILTAYWAITHPDVAHDIAGLTGFKSIETYAGQVSVMPNEFGFYGRGGQGIRFLSTPDASIDAGAGSSTASANDLRTTSGGNVDLYTTVVFGQNSVGTLGLDNMIPMDIGAVERSVPPIEIINKSFGSAGSADPLNELSTLGWKMWAAAKILNGTWIRGIRSGATDLS